MDERQPLLRSNDTNGTIASRDSDVLDSTRKYKDYLVDFDPNGDEANPREWPRAYKWSIVALLAFMAFTTTFTCIGVVPVASHIVADLDGSDAKRSSSVLLVTIWELGEAAGPLLIAPLSEMFGRYPVMNVANVLFILSVLLAALSPTSTVLIAARFFNGLAVVANVLNPAIVGDIFISEQRGAPMSIVFLAMLTGGSIGPAISGAIAEAIGWRAVLWICLVLAGVMELLVLFCFRETYKISILAKRAAQLRKETGVEEWRSVEEVNGDDKTASVLEGILRPAIVLTGSGLLLAMCLFGSVSFTFFYIMSTTLPNILEQIYHLSSSQTGLSFLSFNVGSIAAVITCNVFLDRIYITLRDRHMRTSSSSTSPDNETEANKHGKPEYRLPLSIFGGTLLIPVVAFYGWTAQLRLPLPVMLIASCLLGFSLMITTLPVISYVVDAFGLYSASAMTAVIVTRCLFGTFLPLTASPLIDAVGYGWTFTILAGVALVFAPVPVLVMRYGAVWRQKSKYSKDQ